MLKNIIHVAVSLLIIAVTHGAATPDERPGGAKEWGFRPAENDLSPVTPPGFCWRPQKNAASYALQCARSADFAEVQYQADGIGYNVHCPPSTLKAGDWFWRFRFVAKDGAVSKWSKPRAFTVAKDATPMPLPGREDLLARIPASHPRLWVRPEQMAELRTRARTDLKPIYDKLVKSCEKLLKTPPPTEEPPKYPAGTKRGSDPWRKIWWGNRTYTRKALDGAATLAFTHLLDGNEVYGQLARKILLECATWDPKGATGYRYNDEAGMPYAYYFSRTYTFVYDLLTEEEREICRKMMTIRGREMYKHLCPRHLWRPYASHSNRAWHFLGEIGIAFFNEIPEAEEWAWFAANVFANVYPVWCDADGGWHEGMAYWSSYIGRFTWWADIMQSAIGVNAYDKPYFSQIGYYAMTMQPPGTQGGGFGDLTAKRTSKKNASLLSTFATQSQNSHWQWYVESHKKPGLPGGYIGFIRGALPVVEPRAPLDLPTSRCFRGTGQAVLNATLLDATKNVEIIFKSSPFGTQSHGYESQNSFLLYAFGERLFIRTGRRDSYGSKHHKQWMWQTKSTNCITVNGEGQQGHSGTARGKITDFATSAEIDYVVGDATPAYMGKLKRFVRRILFIKPEIIIIFDTLKAPKPSSFEWLLHAPVEMTVNGPRNIRIANGKAQCKAAFLWPPELSISQTDKFETPPRPRIKLVEYHLTAQTKKKAEEVQFVTVFRPHLTGTTLPAGEAELVEVPGGFGVTVPLSNGRLCALLRTAQTGNIEGVGLSTDANIAVIKFDANGTPGARFMNGGSRLELR